MGDMVSLAQRAVLGDVLNGSTIRDDPTLLSAAGVVSTVELGEAPLVGSHDLLSSGELELGSSQGLNDVSGIAVL